jgi:hypothetical protein
MFFSILITIIWFFIYIFTQTFDLRVFDEKTTIFLAAFSFAVFVINILLAIFNISLNTSIIADLKTGEVPLIDSKHKKKVIILSVSIITIITLVLFIGNLITVNIEKKRLIDEAQFIISNHQPAFSRISYNLSNSNYREVSNILNNITSQNKEYPSIKVIINSKFHDQTAFIYIDSDIDEDKKINYKTQYYATNKKEYQYFKSFLIDKIITRDFLYIDDYSIYIYAPFSNKLFNYILLFKKPKRTHGFIGS